MHTPLVMFIFVILTAWVLDR